MDNFFLNRFSFQLRLQNAIITPIARTQAHHFLSFYAMREIIDRPPIYPIVPRDILRIISQRDDDSI